MGRICAVPAAGAPFASGRRVRGVPAGPRPAFTGIGSVRTGLRPAFTGIGSVRTGLRPVFTGIGPVFTGLRLVLTETGRVVPASVARGVGARVCGFSSGHGLRPPFARSRRPRFRQRPADGAALEIVSAVGDFWFAETSFLPKWRNFLNISEQILHRFKLYTLK